MRLQKHQKKLVGLFLVLFSFLLALVLHVSEALDFLEFKTLDKRIELSERETAANSDVVLVMIDEASLQSMQGLVGRWPWPRALFADLIEFLTMSGARAVLFDVLFTEPQDRRNEYGELGDSDYALATVTLDSGIVVHAAQFLKDKQDETNKTLLNRPLPEDYIQKNALNMVSISPDSKIPGANNFYLPFEELSQAANRVGIVEFRPDTDGVYRRSALVREYQGNYFPVLSLAAIQKVLEPEGFELTEEELKFGEYEIPLQADGTFLINMKKDFNEFSIGGVFASIQAMQLGDMENMLVTPEEFQDKIVIIGASAAGVEDLKLTATGKDVPGVLLHASIISNILDQDYVTNTPGTLLLPVVLLLTILMVVLVLAFHSAIVQVVVPAAIALVYLIIAYFTMDLGRIWIPIAFPLVSFAVAYLGAQIFLSLTEGKERRKTRKMLSQYVSPAVLSEVMDKSGKALTAEVGTIEELTILFSDIRSFTSFSEANEPSQVVEQLNFYLGEMVDSVFEHKGTLDKFIGDAVMAFWGAPIVSDTHANDGVMAALDMVYRLKAVNQHFEEKGYPLFRIGIGLHTGKVILGNIGSDKKLDYTVIGDGVNLASRMEGLTKEYGQEILISESTYQQLGDKIPCRVLDAVKVKGKVKPVKIYTPTAAPDADAATKTAGRELAEKVGQAFQLYQTMQWDAALNEYSQVLEVMVGDIPCQKIVERCKEFMDSPPPDDWDGSYTMKTK